MRIFIRLSLHLPETVADLLRCASFRFIECEVCSAVVNQHIACKAQLEDCPERIPSGDSRNNVVVKFHANLPQPAFRGEDFVENLILKSLDVQLQQINKPQILLPQDGL